MKEAGEKSDFAAQTDQVKPTDMQPERKLRRTDVSHNTSPKGRTDFSKNVYPKDQDLTPSYKWKWRWRKEAASKAVTLSSFQVSSRVESGAPNTHTPDLR